MVAGRAVPATDRRRRLSGGHTCRAKTLVAVATRLAPGELRCERVSGVLAGPLHLENCRYRQDGLAVDLRRADLDWAPSRLLNGRLQIERLDLDGLDLQLPEAAPETPAAAPWRLEPLPLPLQLSIVANATAVRIWPPGAAQPLLIDALQLRAATQAQVVQLDRLAVQAPAGVIELAGRLELAGANPLELDVQGTWRDPRYGPLTIQGRLAGALQEDLKVTLQWPARRRERCKGPCPGC